MPLPSKIRNQIINPVDEVDASVPEDLMLFNNLHHIEVKDLGIYSGVYFLVYKNTVVYVGQSINIVNRINTHIKEDEKMFDSAFTIPLEVDFQTLLLIEAALIRVFRPYYNVKASKPIPEKRRKRDAKLITELIYGQNHAQHFQRIFNAIEKERWSKMTLWQQIKEHNKGVFKMN